MAIDAKMIGFIILVAFSCMVWAGGMTFLLILSGREIDQLKIKASENESKAKMYSRHYMDHTTEIGRLEKENAKLSCDLFLCRSYVERLRARAGDRRYVNTDVLQSGEIN